MSKMSNEHVRISETECFTQQFSADVQLEFMHLTPTSKMPQKAHSYDAAWDLFADCGGEEGYLDIHPGLTKIVPTGVAICPPRGWSCDIRGRSGMNSKGKLAILGLVDADYTGPWGIVIFNSTDQIVRINHHDKIAQFTVNRVYSSEIVTVREFNLGENARANAGFGSTGN